MIILMSIHYIRMYALIHIYISKFKCLCETHNYYTTIEITLRVVFRKLIIKMRYIYNDLILNIGFAFKIRRFLINNILCNYGRIYA